MREKFEAREDKQIFYFQRTSTRSNRAKFRFLFQVKMNKKRNKKPLKQLMKIKN